MSGFSLSQAHGKGALTQQTLMPGQWDGMPVLPAHGSYTCNPGTMDMWRCVAVTFTLVTDDTDASRYVQVQYPFGTGGMLARDVTGYAQVASKTVQYSGALDQIIAQDGAANVTAQFRLSGLFRYAGQAITIAIINAGDDDTLSAVAITVDRTIVVNDQSQPVSAVVLEEHVN